MNSEGIISGDLRREAWSLAWPTILAGMLVNLTMMMDIFFVGRLGAGAVSAVGICSQLSWTFASAMMAVTTGTTALVARFVGARELHQAATAARQGIILSALVALAVAVPLYILRWWVLAAFGMPHAVRGMASLYLSISLLGLVPNFIFVCLLCIFRGLGDMTTPLRALVLTNGLHLTGDLVLIFGWGPIPALGVRGAAIASATSMLVGASVCGWWLSRSGLWEVHDGGWRPRLDWCWRTFRIGLPAAVQNVLRSTGMLVFTIILGRTAHPVTAVAALIMGMRVEGLAFMPGFAFGMVATTIVGQNLGARQPERAERGAWMCTWQAVAFMSGVGVFLFALAPEIAGILTSKARVAEMTVSYLRINALGEPFLALGVTLTSALQGAGDTVFPAVVTALTTWIVRLPAAWLICLLAGYGAPGAWWTMTGSTLCYGLTMAGWFRTGRWKTKRV